jgi:thiol-disulfide isomerase/thioredoxin
LVISVFCFSSFFLFSCQSQTQKSQEETSAVKTETASNLPKVTQIDAPSLKNLLKPNGRPLLINFWATWCAPCREEFPDLVEIGTDYKGKIDLITVSLDELSEIDGEVPKFLAQMKSEFPAYLLKTPDEEAAIGLVSKDWQGALPFTILFDAQGETVYSKQGKFKSDILTAEIEKTLAF